MALIACPDCENQISDQAQSCIYCGRPTGRLDVAAGSESGGQTVDEPERTDPRVRTDVGRNLIDDGPKGMNRYGYRILGAAVGVGGGLGFIIGEVWGFFIFAILLMTGICLAYT